MSIWDSVISAGGSMLSGIFDDDDSEQKVTTTNKVTPSTVGGTKIQDFDVLFNSQAVNAMYDLSNQMGEWAARDRNFYQNTYLPYQQQVQQTNMSMLPAIEGASKAALEANARDIMKNDLLKDVLRTKAGQGDARIEGYLNQFDQALKAIPDENTRVGQALAGVEEQFGQAGKELVRDFQSRGQSVTQTSARALAMEKAKAKAGAAQTASEAARQEKMQGLSAGLAGAAQALGTQSTASAQNVQSIATLQGTQQFGLAMPQLQQDRVTGLEASQLQSGLATTAATQQFGTRLKEDDVTQTQAGVAAPTMTSGATGQGVAHAGIAQPGSPSDRIQMNRAGSGLLNALQQATSGVANPR